MSADAQYPVSREGEEHSGPPGVFLREDVEERARATRMIVFDVDGVLTDGSLFYGDDGQEYKAFNSRDGHGIKMLAEAGIKDMVVTAWFGLVAPAGTPPEIVNKIQQATKKVLETPEIRDRFIEMGGTPGGNTPAEFAAFIDRERESWKQIVETANLTME